MSQIFSRTSGHNRCQDSPYEVFFPAFSVPHAPEFSSSEFPSSGAWLTAVRGPHIQTEGHRGSTLTHTFTRAGAGLGVRRGRKTCHFCRLSGHREFGSPEKCSVSSFHSLHQALGLFQSILFLVQIKVRIWPGGQ